jgi:hypothetical protein
MPWPIETRQAKKLHDTLPHPRVQRKLAPVVPAGVIFAEVLATFLNAMPIGR